MNRVSCFLLLLAISYLYAEEVNWEIALSGRVIQTPIERGMDELVLICEDRRVYSIDIKTGNINWRKRVGGKLKDLMLSPDGSIVTRSDYNMYSLFPGGEIRWKLDVIKGFQSNITINDRGDIFYISDSTLYRVDRFMSINDILDNVSSSSICLINNSLIGYLENNQVVTVTYSGEKAWNLELNRDALYLDSYGDKVIIVYKNGDLESYSSSGHLTQEWSSGNKNPTNFFVNSSGEYLLKGDSGFSLLNEDGVTLYTPDSEYGVLHSSGIIIRALKNWNIVATNNTKVSKYYPSGFKKRVERSLSRSKKTVWGDSRLKEFYRASIIDGNRSLQNPILDEITLSLHDKDLLDKIPNFYDALLLSTSKRNPNIDTRVKAYNIIGKSRDISFLPYLLSDLETEESYQILPHIIYALGQLATDYNGEVISLINSRIDDFHDEQIAIHALYALFSINRYNNGEYINKIYDGIEKILNGGYSDSIEKLCYDIIKKMK